MLDMEHVAVAVLAAQRVELAPVLTGGVLVRPATCAMVSAEAEKSPMIQATLSRSTMRSALVEAVWGLTECFLQQFELAAIDAAGGIGSLGGEVCRHDAVFAERAEEAGARRQVSEADRVRCLRQDDRGLAISPVAVTPSPASAWRREGRFLFDLTFGSSQNAFRASWRRGFDVVRLVCGLRAACRDL